MTVVCQLAPFCSSLMLDRTGWTFCAAGYIQCLPSLQVAALTQHSHYTLYAAGGPCSNEQNKSPAVF